MIEIPTPEYGKNDKETIDNLMDTVMKMRKTLEYLLYHLGDDNIPELPGIKTDIENNTITITNNSASIELLEGEMILKVSKDGVISAINLSPEAIQLDAARINLNGVVTMDSLARVYGTLSLGTPYSTYAILNMGTGLTLRAIGDLLNVEGRMNVDGYIVATSLVANSVQAGDTLNLDAPNGVFVNGVQIGV